MKSRNSYQNIEKLNVLITAEEKAEAKDLAREKGMTFSGFIGNLVKEELKREERTEREDV